MARPRSFDTDAVLAQAMQVFWRKGFAATSMSDIYEATGLKPSSIYAAFKDKDGLFRAAFEHYGAHFVASLPTDLDGVDAVLAWLDVQADLATSDRERKGCMIVNTLGERFMHAPETQALADRRLAEIRAFFADNLRRAQARGEIVEDADTEALADGLASSVLGLMMLGRAGSPEAAIRAAADMAKRAVRSVQPA